MTEQQFTTLREALVLIHNVPSPADPYSNEFETARLNYIAASELIDATNIAVRQAKGLAEN
jgi:hypothetical protein